MVTVDMKGLLLRLNPYCTNQLQAAAGLCVSRTHYEISVEHFLVKILEEPRSDVPLILQKFGIEVGKMMKSLEEVLEDYKAGNPGKPVFSPLLLDLVQEAWLVASIDLEERLIRSGAVLLALLTRPMFFASGRYGDTLKTVNRETLLKDFWAMTKSSVEARTESVGAAGPVGKPEAGKGGRRQFSRPVLHRFHPESP